MTWADAVTPLRSAPFRRFFVGRTSSFLGSTMVSVALAFAVLDISGSPTDLGFVLAARTLPLAVLLLVGGVVADRFRRDHVLVVSHLVSFATQAVAAALLLLGHATVPYLIAVEAVNGAALAFTFPALQGVIPQLVERPLLQQANALLGMVRGAVYVVGPMLASLIVVVAGSGWAIAVDALTWLLAAVAFTGLRLGRVDHAESATMVGDLRAGWSEFTGRTWLWVIVVAFGVLNAVHAGVWFTLGPVIADDTFGRGPWGVILGAESAGLLVATVLLLRMPLRFPLRAGMVGISALAPAMFALGAFPHEGLLVGLALVAGFGTEIFGIGWQTALQQHIPVEVLSRVSSYDALGSFVAVPVGQMLAGPLAEAFGVRAVAASGAVLYLVVALGTLLVPSVRTLGRAAGAGHDVEPSPRSG